MADYCDNCGSECPKCPPEGSPPWMASFADLATLLLTFFVLLLSFANMDIVKFQDMAGSMKDAFGYTEENFGNFHPEMIARKSKVKSAVEQTMTGGPRKEMREMKKKVQDLIEKKKMEKDVSASVDHRGLIIRVKDNVMFTPGGARLKRKGFPILDDVAKLLQEFPCDIVIQGHTDDSPIRTRQFPSNWELSGSRAISVMRYMVEVGGIDPQRLGTAGYADQRPIVPNDNLDNRKKNRRVEFVCQRNMKPKEHIYKSDEEMEAEGEAKAAAEAAAAAEAEGGAEGEEGAEDTEGEEGAEGEEEDEEEEDEEEEDEEEEDEEEEDEEEEDEEEEDE